MSEWISVEQEKPVSGEHVLLCCEMRCFGGNVKKYVCDGFWAERYKHEAGGFPDECACEYSEENDEYYLLEGWYEVIKNWDEYNSVAIGDFVTHWMPLPAPPEDKAAKCEHEFVYDELHGRAVCKKCLCVLTGAEKRAALEYANELRRAEEAEIV